MDYILTTNELTKTYGKYNAANEVSIHVERGGIYGLIGRNGAGKTTLMKMIGGLSHPSRGSFEIHGRNGETTKQMMPKVGILIEAPGLYPNMTAMQNLTTKAIALGIKDKQYLKSLLEEVGLSNTGKKKAKQFSLGMKQRLGIAMALVNKPELLILDEPINGLDPQGIAEMRSILHHLCYDKGITILISSHILDELSKVATQYGIIHEGRLLEEETKDELFSKCCERLELKTNNISKTLEVLNMMGFSKMEVKDDAINIYERLNEGGAITIALAKENIQTNEIAVKTDALEDYYFQLTGGNKNA
ncbi:MAG TPA: bacitracin ABC transporter ATP-binding protein [Clostridiales bacterium]|nr:bacitracin ABC transporter ATP-binding protein [Clostridiales bacterium]